MPNHLSCAFAKCNGTSLDPFIEHVLQNANSGGGADGEDPVLRLQNSLSSTTSWNLPRFIAFPETVSHVGQAVEWAKQRQVPISIKSTGHSYTGSSTLTGSLQLNLRQLKSYSAHSITECDTVLKDDNEEGDNDPNARPFQAACRLARARGKQAVVQVGGGEVWSDVYLALLASQALGQTVHSYEAVGGGAGSVGAAGGWLQGGGWSTGMERQYGLGVDQVLELQMVLADGRHVKFGPTAWQDAPGFVYPQTTVVTGYCNFNVHEAQDKDDEWEWKPCLHPEPPFDDLWFAVRGGGGGTYGIVTSVVYQLHPARPRDVVFVNEAQATSLVQSLSADGTDMEGLSMRLAPIVGLVALFFVDVLFNPQRIGLTSEIADQCGAPLLEFYFLRGSVMGCYDGLGTPVLQAWQAAVSAAAVVPPQLGGLDPALVDNVQNLFALATFDSYPEAYAAFATDPWHPPGKIPDRPLPGILPDFGSTLQLQTNGGAPTNGQGRQSGGWCSAQIPLEWLQQSDMVDRVEIATVLTTIPGMHTTGGRVATAHDQTTAITHAHRQSGLTTAMLSLLDTQQQSKLLQASVKSSAPMSGLFPGVSEINHLCSDSFGPLKEDWTQPCPVNWTVQEKEEKCISVEESIWGTQVLDRLIKIKTAVDPNNLFECYPCVKSTKEQNAKDNHGKKGKKDSMNDSHGKKVKTLKTRKKSKGDDDKDKGKKETWKGYY